MCLSNIHTYRFCDDPELVRAMRATFAGQYSIDQVIKYDSSVTLSTSLQTTEGDVVTKLALENPHKYVMKPQREGGGKECND